MYIYKVEFEYDIDKHSKIISKINKSTKVVASIFLVASLLILVGTIFKLKENGPLTLLIPLVLLMMAITLMLAASKRKNRKKLLKLYGNDQIKYTYEYYDEYIKIYRTGGAYESEAKMKYSAFTNAACIDEELGYATTKELSIVFIVGSQTKEIVEFINQKISLNI